MVYEDFTGFTELDPNSDIVVTTNNIAVTTLVQPTVASVKKSYGAGHFGDFEHLVQTEIKTSDPDFFGGYHAVNDGEDSLWAMNIGNVGISASIIRGHGGAYRMFNVDYDTDNSDIFNLSKDTPYYMTIERAGNVYTCKVYDDSARTSLVDTNTLTCNEDTYEYLMAMFSWGHANDTEAGTYEIDNLDIQEAVEHTHSASDTLAISDSLSVAATYNVSLGDTLSIGDSLAAAMQFNVALSDTLSLSDALAAAATYNVALADTLNISDNVVAAAAFVVALADTLNMSDSLVAGLIYYVSLADQMDITDSLSYEAFVAAVRKIRRGNIYGIKPARPVKVGRIGA